MKCNPSGSTQITFNADVSDDIDTSVSNKIKNWTNMGFTMFIQ